MDLPPALGIRRVVGVCANERGEAIELTEAPALRHACGAVRPFGASTGCGSRG